MYAPSGTWKTVYVASRMMLCWVQLGLWLRLLGHVALVRGAVAYSHQTFPQMICRSVRRSVQCIVENGRSDTDAVWITGRTGPGMRHVVEFGDRSTERGTFGGEFGVHHCNQWGLTFAAMWPSSQITLGRLVMIIVLFTHQVRHNWNVTFEAECVLTASEWTKKQINEWMNECRKMNLDKWWLLKGQWWTTHIKWSLHSPVLSLHFEQTQVHNYTVPQKSSHH